VSGFNSPPYVGETLMRGSELLTPLRFGRASFHLVSVLPYWFGLLEPVADPVEPFSSDGPESPFTMASFPGLHVAVPRSGRSTSVILLRVAHQSGRCHDRNFPVDQILFRIITISPSSASPP